MTIMILCFSLLDKSRVCYKRDNKNPFNRQGTPGDRFTKHRKS